MLEPGPLVVERRRARDPEPPRGHRQLVRPVRERDVEAAPARPARAARAAARRSCRALPSRDRPPWWPITVASIPCSSEQLQRLRVVARGDLDLVRRAPRAARQRPEDQHVRRVAVMSIQTRTSIGRMQHALAGARPQRHSHLPRRPRLQQLRRPARPRADARGRRRCARGGITLPRHGRHLRRRRAASASSARSSTAGATGSCSRRSSAWAPDEAHAARLARVHAARARRLAGAAAHRPCGPLLLPPAGRDHADRRDDRARWSSSSTKGSVRAIGVSNFTVGAARRGGRRRARSRRSRTTTACSSARRRPTSCRAAPSSGSASCPYFPLASGLLTGKYRRGEPPPAGHAPRRPAGGARPTRSFDRIEALEAFARRARAHAARARDRGSRLAAGVASVIAGATKPEQVRANAAAGDWELSADDLAALRSL